MILESACHTACVSFSTPHRRLTLTAAALAVAVAAAGVTLFLTRDTDRPPAATAHAADQQPATQAPTQAPAPATATTGPAQPAQPRKFGESVTAAGLVKATVHAYQQPTAKSAPRPEEPGYVWAAVDVEVCPVETNTVSRSPWHLLYADNTTAEPSNIGYRQFPKPEYPWDDREVAAGRCIRGWIVFEVPAGKRPTVVQYQPSGLLFEWKVT